MKRWTTTSRRVSSLAGSLPAAPHLASPPVRLSPCIVHYLDLPPLVLTCCRQLMLFLKRHACLNCTSSQQLHGGIDSSIEGLART